MSTFNPAAEAVQATFLPQRSIGPFTATVTIEEVGTDDLEITQHPVQQGAAITDHAYLKPASLSLRVGWSPLSGSTLAEIYADLLALQAKREPLNVVTGKRQYQNMLIKSLVQTTDKTTEHVLSISAQLQQILLVPVTVTTVPPRAHQANPGKTGATQNAGTKKLQPMDPKSISILKAGFGS